MPCLAGDTTANLFWRIMNGELPVGTRPKLAVVMIGTNDLGYTEACFREGAEVTEAAPGTISRYHVTMLISDVDLPQKFVCSTMEYRGKGPGLCFRKGIEARPPLTQAAGVTEPNLHTMHLTCICKFTPDELSRLLLA